MTFLRRSPNSVGADIVPVAPREGSEAVDLLRSQTRGRLYFDATPPYTTCNAGSTKNRKDARQYIQPVLASDLQAHITTKAPKTPVFNLPHESNLARILRDDLAEARKQWINEAKDAPQKYAQRQQSDFLADDNHEGETTDFHCLRRMAGDDWRTPQRSAESDASPIHHVDHGHIRASFPWTRGRRGGPDA